MNFTDTRYTVLTQKRRLSKRAFDIVFSCMTLLVLSPLMLLIALLVRFTSKGPVFFCHRRLGLGGREISIYKFRTMLHGAEQMKTGFTKEQQAEFSSTYKLQNDPRVTRFGSLLRRTSLDELPQFLNVLKGDMSVIGPRPITRDELEKYDSYSETLLSVNPGITGLWQVSGRNDVSYEDRVQMDIQYVQNISFLMDLKILLMTFVIVTSRIGAY